MPNDGYPDIAAAPWTAPVQQDPPGWQWETAGTASVESPFPTYQGGYLSDTANYFADVGYPASATMLHGQVGKAY